MSSQEDTDDLQSQDSQSQPPANLRPKISSTASSEAGLTSSRGSSDAANHSSASASLLHPTMPLMVESSTYAGVASMSSEPAGRAAQVAVALRSNGMLGHAAGLASPLALGTDNTLLVPIHPYYGAASLENHGAYALSVAQPQSIVINFDQFAPTTTMHAQQQNADRLARGSLLGQYHHHEQNMNSILNSSLLFSSRGLPSLPTGTLLAHQLPHLQFMTGLPVGNPNMMHTSPGASSSRQVAPIQAQVHMPPLPHSMAATMPNIGDPTHQHQNSRLTQRTSAVVGPTVGFPTSTSSSVPLPAATNARLPPFSVLLSLPQDAGRISSYQCLVRKQIEAFNAIQDDVDTHARGRNKPIVIGQVGIRCVHCRLLSKREQQRGSIYFPAKVARLYQAAQNMANVHLCGTCPQVPEALRDELRILRAQKSAVGCGKRYWEEAAMAVGLTDTEEGIRFKHNIAESLST